VCGDRVLARVEVGVHRPDGSVDRLLATVADGGELLVFGQAVELVEDRHFAGSMPFIGLSKTTTAIS
jgi:hypothetical protein